MSSSQPLPDFLTLENDFAVLIPKAEMSLDDAVEMISRAIAYCRANKIDGMLVDARELFGFPHPSVVDRYWFIRKWASETASQVVLSFIQRPEMIDADKIGITIAANAGMTIEVFENEAEAREWLLANLRSDPSS